MSSVTVKRLYLLLKAIRVPLLSQSKPSDPVYSFGLLGDIVYFPSYLTICGRCLGHAGNRSSTAKGMS
jgi:hypothetical protein